MRVPLRDTLLSCQPGCTEAEAQRLSTLSSDLRACSQKRRRRLPNRPCQHCPNHPLLEGPVREQGLLRQSCRRRRSPTQGVSFLAACPAPQPRLSPYRRTSQGSTDLDHIQIIKKVGGKLTDSYLDEGACPSLSRAFSRAQLTPLCAAFFMVPGFILEKSIAVNSPKRIENAKIMIGNTCASPRAFPSTQTPTILTRPPPDALSHGHRQD